MSKKKRLQMQKSVKATGISSGFSWPNFAEQEQLRKKYIAETPKEISIRPDLTEDEWEAAMLQGWVNGRDIPVEELCILFNRDEVTIRRWLAMKV